MRPHDQRENCRKLALVILSIVLLPELDNWYSKEGQASQDDEQGGGKNCIVFIWHTEGAMISHKQTT